MMAGITQPMHSLFTPLGSLFTLLFEFIAGIRQGKPKLQVIG